MFISRKKLDTLLNNAEMEGRRQVSNRGQYSDHVRTNRRISELEDEVRELKEIVVSLCDKSHCTDLYAGKMVVESRKYGQNMLF